MITYNTFNEDGMPLDSEGNIIDITEGKPRLFDGTQVIEFDNNEERDAYLDSLNIE